MSDEGQPDCVVCTYDWEWEQERGTAGTCTHSDADRMTYVLRMIWDTLVPNTTAVDSRNDFASRHVDKVRELSREDAACLQIERDSYHERKGFQRGLAYAIGYLDHPTWKDSRAPEATIIMETYRQWEAHLRGEPYEIRGWPRLPREVEWDRQEAEDA